jgi:hypothetical protein
LPNGKWRFASIYGVGAAMGFTPQQVNAMSMWQFAAAFDGYVKANGGGEEKMSNAEADDLWKWLQSKEGAEF